MPMKKKGTGRKRYGVDTYKGKSFISSHNFDTKSSADKWAKKVRPTARARGETIKRSTFRVHTPAQTRALIKKIETKWKPKKKTKRFGLF